MINTMNIYHYFKAALKYGLLFIIIYTIIHMLRTPDLPNAPNLVYQDIDGKSVNVISQSYQKPVLIYFWGSWCGVCRRTSPNIQKLSQGHNFDNHYEIVSVAISSGSDAELKQYMQKKDYHFQTINDDSGQIFNTWQGTVVPSMVILKDGKIHHGFTGFTPLWLLKTHLWLAK